MTISDPASCRYTLGFSKRMPIFDANAERCNTKEQNKLKVNFIRVDMR